jgi:hypothetical protein
MDQWLSSPKLFHHLLTYKTMAVATVMANRIKLPKPAFSEGMEEGKNCSPRAFW